MLPLPVPGFANLLEYEDRANNRQQEHDCMGWIVLNVHLVTLQLLQMMRMLPAWARFWASAQHLAIHVGIATAIDLAREFLFSRPTWAIATASYCGNEHGCKQNEPHLTEYTACLHRSK